jgi:hypothetical protein
MSSGWDSDSIFIAPVPFGWKLCFSVVAKTICLTLSPLPAALAVELALALELELELEEPELEHPAAPNTLAATTAALSRVAERRL